MKTVFNTLVAAGLLVTAIAVPMSAGVVVYEKDNKKVEIGGRIQLQYLNSSPTGGSSSDDLFFRRLRPYILATVTENWVGKIEFDFGKADGSDEVALKDAYMQYLGWKNHKLTIGNSKTPFSREFLASSKRQQLVERSFAGDHNFGAPDRQLGLRLDGRSSSKKITYSAAVGSEEHDPAIGKLDFDTPVNTQSDFNQGVVVAARIDFHPLGYVAFDQADFCSDEITFNVSASAFNWSNDDDNNTFTNAMGMVTAAGITDGKVDLDNVDGVGISAGVRGKGLSADAEFQRLSAETVDPTWTGGLYLNGASDLDVIAVEAGYMLPKNVEIVVGWDSLDADNFATSVDRTSVGFNWYLNKHKTKLQTTFRSSENLAGVSGADLDEVFAQFQFVF